MLNNLRGDICHKLFSLIVNCNISLIIKYNILYKVSGKLRSLTLTNASGLDCVRLVRYRSFNSD